METLAPPVWPELSMPFCEQTVPGNVTGDEQEGKIGSGRAELGEEPEPLQGGTDPDDPAAGDETGSEGDGT